jgi:hypothetical protein
MRPSTDRGDSADAPSRPAAASLRLTRLLASAAVALALSPWAAAQTAQPAAETSSLCGRDNALEITRQQIDAAKSFDDPARRVAVLVRAADLLWPYRQGEARAAFAEAFGAAEQDYKAKGDEWKKAGRALMVETPDQRYLVIRAVAKRDPAWAKKLTDELLRKERQEAEDAAAKNPQADERAAWKLLDTASALLPSDPAAANTFAAASLRYPAGVRLTEFMYKLAGVDQKAADQFYRQALAAYGDRPLREFLYLAAYPFGLSDSGDMPWTGTYAVPPSFAPDLSLKRLFAQTLLRRAAQTLQAPADEGDNYNGFPAAGHVLQVLTRVGPQVQRLLPDLSGATEQARNNLLSSLQPENQEVFLRPQPDRGSAGKRTFDEQVEAAGREPGVGRRDELLATAVLNAGPAEGLDKVVNAADKISDSALRSQLLDWFYFSRAQGAAKDMRLDEAAELAAKVEEADQRAYLYSEIAKASLGNPDSQGRARALLDEIVTTADKGQDTVVTARALFSAAYLYLNIDPGRSVSIYGDAVKRINRIESPDFSNQSLVRKLEGRNFARYASFKTPGFDPENALRELAKVDFDNALSLASGFADKSLRAQTALALAEFCLQRAGQQEKPPAAKKKGAR